MEWLFFQQPNKVNKCDILVHHPTTMHMVHIQVVFIYYIIPFTTSTISYKLYVNIALFFPGTQKSALHHEALNILILLKNFMHTVLVIPKAG